MQVAGDSPEGEGTGSRFAIDAKRYADETGKRLVVDHFGFLGQEIPGFEPIRKPDGSVGFVYDPAESLAQSTTARIAAGTCPTCGDPLKGEHGTFCPRCSWSEDDANIDSDPLSNPPDPTVDLHRGIQARTVVADKLHNFLMNPKHRPDLQTPEGQRWLKMLDRMHELVGPKFDPLTPWMTREWKKGRIQHSEDGEIGHPYYMWAPPERYDPDSGAYWAGTRQPLLQDTLGHWADFLQSNHPVRRDLGDIMAHHVQPFHERVKTWDEAMRQQMHEEALKGGRSVHTTPDGWNIVHLTKPEELKAEGDAMGHCVGGGNYGTGNSMIYSLRDPQGAPHVTMEMYPRYIDWNGQRINVDTLDMNAPVDEGEDAGVPSPYGAEVVQIQGRANREPKDEYKARLKNYFDTFGYYNRPQWSGDDDGIYNIDELRDRHSQDVDEYGLRSGKPDIAYGQVLDSMIEGKGGYRNPQYDSDDGDDGQRLYNVARKHGEIPDLAEALEKFGESQQENFDEWRDQNYEYTVPSPQGDEEYPYYHNHTGDTYGDAIEHEKAYDEDIAQWEREHAGMQATNHMYQLLNPHYYNGGWQQEPRQTPQEPAQRPQTFTSVIPSHRWFTAVEDAP